ncbi:Retrotran-gag-2 domain-containing protein [Pyrenophora tritici-repentis]|nr:Retrotran-gag-2 domain-containing protein [Pyrenophora tritici-repentis]
MGSDDRYDKEPKIPKLTKENHEKWFRNNKLKLKGKGIFYTIEVTKHAYAWIARHGAGTSTSTANTSQDPAGTVNPTEQASVLGLTSDFERLGGTWNAEKAKEYDKDEAKALFYITNSLLDDDDALADEYETASALWTALKVKYSKTDQLTANNIMTKLQNFTWKDEKDVDYTWAKLKEYRRKIIAAKPAAKGLYNDEALLQIMLRALPESYGSVIDYLDVQTSLTVDEKIAALRTKELRLNDTAEHANVAFPKYRHPNDHRSSDSSMRDRPRSTSPELGPSTGCLHCKGEHWARDCKYKGEIQEFGRKLREKDERAERRAAKSKRPSRNENKKRSDKPVKPTVKTTSRRKHGYAAKNQDSDSGTDNGSSGTDSETSHESTSVETESPAHPSPTITPPAPTVEDESEEMEVDEVTNPVAAEPSARYHFRTRTQKRKRDTFDDMEDEHRQAKIVKAMLAVLRESRADEDPTTEIPTSTHHHEESAHETIVKAFYTVIVSGNLDVTGRAELSGKAFAATEETLGAAVSQATTFESQFFESQTEEEGAAEGSQAGTAATTEASVDTEPDNGDNFDGINWDRLPRFMKPLTTGRRVKSWIFQHGYRVVELYDQNRVWFVCKYCHIHKVIDTGGSGVFDVSKATSSAAAHLGLQKRGHGFTKDGLKPRRTGQQLSLRQTLETGVAVSQEAANAMGNFNIQQFREVAVFCLLDNNLPMELVAVE